MLCWVLNLDVLLKKKKKKENGGKKAYCAQLYESLKVCLKSNVEWDQAPLCTYWTRFGSIGGAFLKPSFNIPRCCFVVLLFYPISCWGLDLMSPVYLKVPVFLLPAPPITSHFHYTISYFAIGLLNRFLKQLFARLKECSVVTSLCHFKYIPSSK